jgi:hypothetical protein
MARSWARTARAIAIAIAVGGCSSSENSPRATTTHSAEALRITGVAPNGQSYPKPVMCNSHGHCYGVYAGDLALLGVVGVSSEPDGATPLAHYRSATADLKAKAITELQRHRGAGLVRCDPEVCDDRDTCGLVVTDIYPNRPDGYVDGSVQPPMKGRPLRWLPSPDYRTVTYATSDRGPAATGALLITLDCNGGCRKVATTR